MGTSALPQDSRQTRVSTGQTLEPRRRRGRGRRVKVGSLEFPEPGGSLALESSSGSSWKSPGCRSQASRPAASTQPPLPFAHLDPGAGMKVLSRENSFEKLEAETNVDTGCTVVNSEPRRSALSRFPRDLQTSWPPPCSPASCVGAAASKNMRLWKGRVHPLSIAGQKELSARRIISHCSLPLPVQGEEKGGEEEFFI